MATAIPTQLYEKVSEVEALSRNDQLDGQMIYQNLQEETLSRSARQGGCKGGCGGGYGGYVQQQQPCKKYCWWSAINKRTVCEYLCNRK